MHETSAEDFLKVFEEYGYNTIQNYVIQEGPLTIEFAQFITKICTTINKFFVTDENVNDVNMIGFENWKFELGSFLRELQCPYDQLFSGDPDQRLEKFKGILMFKKFRLKYFCFQNYSDRFIETIR